jgi:hypothetical protein
MECLLLVSVDAESFVLQFAIQKYEDAQKHILPLVVWVLNLVAPIQEGR